MASDLKRPRSEDRYPGEDKPKYDYVGPSQYAKPVGRYPDGSIMWQAGPKSKKYKNGQIVSETYAKQVRGSIEWRNRVMGLVSNPKEQTPDKFNDARDVLVEFKRLGKDLNKAQEAENKERIEEIEQEIDGLRADMGS